MGFVEDYFINPVIYETGKYNIINTLAYGFVLVIAVYLLYELLKKLKISINSDFALSVIPFIFLGSGLRVLRDAEILRSYMFVTPGSYVITFIIAFASLFISILIQRKFKIEYQKTMMLAGTGLCVPVYFFVFSMFKNFAAFAGIVALSLAWFAIFYVFSKVTPNVFTKPNIAVISAHMFDASSTFVGKYFGYVEEHVVPSMLIPVFGPWTMFLLKLAVVVPILYLFDKNIKDRNFKNWLKIVVLILGLAPALRNTFRIAAMV